MQKILRPENIKVLNPVNAHRLFRWQIKTVTNQAVVDRIDARHIHIPRGYQELARADWGWYGKKSSKPNQRYTYVASSSATIYFNRPRNR